MSLHTHKHSADYERIGRVKPAKKDAVSVIVAGFETTELLLDCDLESTSTLTMIPLLNRWTRRGRKPIPTCLSQHA
jgi:hypothetical protein